MRGQTCDPPQSRVPGTGLESSHPGAAVSEAMEVLLLLLDEVDDLCAILWHRALTLLGAL